MAGGAALAVKAAVALVTDEKTRKGVGWIIAAILSPLIVLIALIATFMSGGAAHNIAVVDLAFKGGVMGANVPQEYRTHVTAMQNVFANIDGEVAEINADLDAVHSLDETLVKAVFYSLFFGEPSPGRINISKFTACFTTEKEITRNILDENGEVIGTEMVTLTVAETDMQTVYQRIGTATGVVADADDIINANEIYYRQKFEVIPLSEMMKDIPFVGLDGFVEPVADWCPSVSSEYGPREHPVYGGPDFHPAIDIAKPAGTPVYAVLDGVVSIAHYHAEYGYYVRINHGGGFETLYAHNYKLLVAPEQEVKAGDIIAQVGTTGTSTGNHLHFETIVDGVQVNPRIYLP